MECLLQLFTQVRMKKILTKGRISLLVIVSVLLIDQIIKVIVKTNMYFHESIHITDWFYIYFTENNGMAFGMEIFGKLFLTSFRIIAVGFIAWYLYKTIKKGAKTGYIICVSLILTGALGNIIDSVFYGVLFDQSTNSSIATFLPTEGGYSTCSMARWSICFIFPSSIQPGLCGCRLLVANILYSSVRYSILQMQLLVVVLLHCFCFTVNI